MRGTILLALLASLASTARAAVVVRSALSVTADEVSCSPGPPATLFRPDDRQAFLWFVARSVHVGDRIAVDWMAPDGSIAQSTPYTDLPGATTLCFTTPLPIAGFPAASQAGSWKVRILVNDGIARTLLFQIEGAPDPGPRTMRVSARQVVDKTEIAVDGAGFTANSVIHVAQYSASGGWKYIASAAPGAGAAESRLSITTPKLAPGEYVVFVRNPDDRVSAPARFLIGSEGGYRLPTAAGEPWIVTQGPYGSFSHWNRSLHAWDIAPTSSRFVVAMRSGIAYTHDLGLTRTLNRRSFGNYITIDHGDGEYSHYAHLASGTFLVRNGEHVEQGQSLALAGNSGFALGEGGGVHLHVHLTRSASIAAPSIPLQFEDAPESARIGFRGALVSTNTSSGAAVTPQGRRAVAGASEVMRGEIQAAQWWNRLLPVSPAARTLSLRLSWDGAGNDADLHLVSPSGKHYGWYGETNGYSGRTSNPEEIRISDPEPGTWRISVQAIRSDGAGLAFDVTATVEQPPRRVAAHSRLRRILQ
jgi:murein DD-endopeptidase MepM/ murein hydrolase activator NlpD